MEDKNQYFQELKGACMAYFGFCFALRKIFFLIFVLIITDGRRIYNRRKENLYSNIQIDS